MTIEKLLFFWLSLCLPLLGTSQNTIHSIGFSVNRLSFQPLEYLYHSNTQPEFYRRNQSETRHNFPVSYHLKRKIKGFKNIPFDLSIDIPLEAALFWSTDQNNQSSHYVNLGLPLMITANYGAFSFSEMDDKPPFGLFAGFGPIWQLTRGNLGRKSHVSPHVIAGIRFKINEKRGIELSYAQNLFFSTIRSEESGDEYYKPDWAEVESVNYKAQYISARFIF